MSIAPRVERELKEDGYPIMMTAAEAARALRCSESSVWRWAEAGRLKKHVRGERAVFFSRIEVAEMWAGDR